MERVLSFRSAGVKKFRWAFRERDRKREREREREGERGVKRGARRREREWSVDGATAALIKHTCCLRGEKRQPR
jgi:hypothetical protein